MVCEFFSEDEEDEEENEVLILVLMEDGLRVHSVLSS